MIHATVDLGQMVERVSQQLELEAGGNGCLAVLHNRNEGVCAEQLRQGGQLKGQGDLKGLRCVRG